LIQLKKKVHQKVLSWSFALPGVIFLTSCNSVIATRGRVGSPLFELGQHPVFLEIFNPVFFVVFTFLLIFQVIGDISAIFTFWEEKKHEGIRKLLIWVFFYYFDIFIDYRDIYDYFSVPGFIFVSFFSPIDFLIPLYLFVYPVGFFYFKYINALPFTLTRFPNLDFLLFWIIFPVLFFALIAWVIIVTRTSNFFVFRCLWFVWKTLCTFVKFTCIMLLITNFILWLFWR
jgi:hypothetical protein